MAGEQGQKDRIPQVAVRRLPVYLRTLSQVRDQGIEIVSSADLALLTGFSSEQIRKDFAYFGAFGTRGRGYNTATLVNRLRTILGLDQELKAALVGAGHLGTALARYSLSRQRDVPIVSIFDNDPERIGRAIGPITVESVDRLEETVREQGIRLAILAVPAGAAQGVASRLSAAGIEAILNFSPTKLDLPPDVYVQQIDLGLELQSMAYFAAQGRRN